MEILLKDEKIYPDDQVIHAALGSVYSVYKEFMTRIQNESIGLAPEWRYYRDGKAWLCKIVYKKKTVLWLSLWQPFFKVVSYYTEKTIPGVYDLPIDEKIKESVRTGVRIGKFIPVIIEVSQKEQLEDIYKIIEYKKAIK
jgi:hypothetical protein